MGEKSTEDKLIVVRITNLNRLHADVTEDFFLIPPEHYMRAQRIVREMESYEGTRVIKTIEEVTRRLDGGGIDYHHVLEGSRYFLGIVGDEKGDN